MDQLSPAGGVGFLAEAYDQLTIYLVSEIVDALANEDDGADLKAPHAREYCIRHLLGARVEVISSGTEEGAMLKSFGGVAAFLRYKMTGA